MARIAALVPAAGVGARAGSVIPKQYQRIDGRAVIAHTLCALAASREITHIEIVVSPSDEWIDDALSRVAPAVRSQCEIARCGGQTRAQSVRNGLEKLRRRYKDDDWVLVHDAARCCVTPAMIQRLIAEIGDDAVGGLLALPVPDTVKIQTESLPARVAQTTDRSTLWLAQTPQMFRLGMLYDALSRADTTLITDEASALEQFGHAPRLVRGAAENFKVTYAEDFALAEAILAARARVSG